ncbi:DUF982 domain-containing protein [Mesorhizobium sp. M0833]|uniref:DUF982 domain-containing protein n=1 Tax=Mesorhizobium sp. M0833 TaxID=2957009 RepID=UPI0033363DBD
MVQPSGPRQNRASRIIRNVDNVKTADEELMKWTKRGPWWDLAVRVCMAVIYDQMEAEEARKAFLAAGVLPSTGVRYLIIPDADARHGMSVGALPAVRDCIQKLSVFGEHSFCLPVGFARRIPRIQTGERR